MASPAVSGHETFQLSIGTSHQPVRILVVEDDPASADPLKIYLERRGYEVRIAPDGRTSEVLCAIFQPDVILLDLGLPDVDGLDLLARFQELAPEGQVIVISGRATVSRTVEAMQAGALSVVEKPVSVDRLIETLERVHLAQGPVTDPDGWAADVTRLSGMTTRSPQMRDVFEMVKTAAPVDVTVLVVGESGTGKELVANAIHELSPRRGGPLVRLNCAAIPGELLESELFGHRRGAFTDATADQRGLLEQAHRGSLLLDEIAEMPPRLQVKLLRVLQEREFRPLGAGQPVKADFRLICATNVEPEQALREGRLRHDLFFRINTITVRLPPLRQRSVDIPVLAHEFLTRFAADHQRPLQGFRADAMELLERFDWPGNIRELEHVIERAVILATGPYIEVSDLPPAVQGNRVKRPSKSPVPLGCTLSDLERLAILQALEVTHWNKRATASILGIPRPTLYNKLRKHRLWRDEDRFRREV